MCSHFRSDVFLKRSIENPDGGEGYAQEGASCRCLTPKPLVICSVPGLEIDKPLLNIHGYQLYTKPVPDIHALEPVDELAFNRHRKQPDPGPFLGSAGDNRIELLSDP